MKARIQILSVVVNAGRSKKTGNDYDMRMAQCIVHKVMQDGSIMPMVGELLLPEKYKETPPGNYDVEFEISISQDKRIGSVVSSIEAVKPAGVVNPTVKAA